MRAVSLFAVNGEGLEHVLERHAVVGFFPHLLGEVQVALGCVHVGVHTECQGLVDQQLVGVEVRHEERDGVTLFVGHLLEVGDVFAQLDLVGEPRVGYGLVIQVHGPLVGNRLEQQSFFNSGAENSHDVSLVSCRKIVMSE